MTLAEATDSSVTASAVESGEPIIKIVGMHKWYGQFHVLKNVNLNVKPKERIVICGPSGSGKSTMIRCINRLEEHQQGDVIVDGITLTGNSKNIEAVRREVGMVFQHFNLFPHMSILDNCTYGPIWVRQMPKREAEELAMHFLVHMFPRSLHKSRLHEGSSPNSTRICLQCERPQLTWIVAQVDSTHIYWWTSLGLQPELS